MRNPILCFRNHETTGKIERPSSHSSRSQQVVVLVVVGRKDADFSLHRSIYPNASGPAKTCLASLRRLETRAPVTRVFARTVPPDPLIGFMRPTSLCYLSLSLLQRRWKVPATRTRCNAALISISRRGKTWGGGGDTPDSARSRGRATKRRRLWTRRKGRGGIRNAIRESVKPREWLSEKS